MGKLKLKFNYGNDFRVFDLTVSVVGEDSLGYVFIPAQMESERILILAPGNYLLQAHYDLPEAGGKLSCLFEKRFHSESVERVSINFRRPTSTIPPFSKEELEQLRLALAVVGTRVNARPEQVFVSNIVKPLPAACIEERVVVDKNGRVDYEFSYAEQEVYDLPEEEEPVECEPVVATFDRVGPRPFIHTAFNYGYWDVNLYGLLLNAGPLKKGYRTVRATGYLRPRTELFKRLPSLLTECMEVARRLNILDSR